MCEQYIERMFVVVVIETKTNRLIARNNNNYNHYDASWNDLNLINNWQKKKKQKQTAKFACDKNELNQNLKLIKTPLRLPTNLKWFACGTPLLTPLVTNKT